MQTTTKFVIFFSISLTILFGSIIYLFLNSFFGTNPSLKEYEIYGHTQTFGSNLTYILKSDSNIHVKFRDTTFGEFGPKVSVDISYKTQANQYAYSLTYQPAKKQNSNYNHIYLNLIGAFDRKNNFGGYKKNDEKMDELIKSFDSLIIKKIHGLVIKTN